MSRSWLFLATNNLLSACSEAANYRGALIMLRAEVLGNTCSAVGQRLFKPRKTLCSGVAAGAFHVHDLWPNSNVACPTTPVQSWVVASPQATVYATVTCQADAHRCMQMLYNLVTNVSSLASCVAIPRSAVSSLSFSWRRAGFVHRTSHTTIFPAFSRS